MKIIQQAIPILASRPKKWENDAIALMIRMCRKHDCPVHIVHVASDEALAQIEAAKKEGLLITAETCTQYLYFNAEGIPNGSSIYKCAPPIRDQANNSNLKQAFLSGVLDFVTTDHSPAPPAIKEMESGNLKKAWGGIAGIQFLLAGSWTALKDMMTLEQFIPLVTSKPAAFLKSKSKGTIAVDYDADFVIWNPEQSQTITEEDIFFRYKISPYIAQTLSGVVVETIVNGDSVYQNKSPEAQPNCLERSGKNHHKNKGQWLLKK